MRKNICEENELNTVKADTSPFKTSPGRLLYNFSSQSYSKWQKFQLQFKVVRSISVFFFSQSILFLRPTSATDKFNNPREKKIDFRFILHFSLFQSFRVETYTERSSYSQFATSNDFRGPVVFSRINRGWFIVRPVSGGKLVPR